MRRPNKVAGAALVGALCLPAVFPRDAAAQATVAQIEALCERSRDVPAACRMIVDQQKTVIDLRKSLDDYEAPAASARDAMSKAHAAGVRLENAIRSLRAVLGE